jgi:hypothetical protein
MYLHIGEDVVVNGKDIIGIFDFETATLSKNTQNYLRDKEKKGKTVTIGKEMPKAFIVVEGKKEIHSKVYLTLVSSLTLKRRAENYKLMEL